MTRSRSPRSADKFLEKYIPVTMARIRRDVSDEKHTIMMSCGLIPTLSLRFRVMISGSFMVWENELCRI